MNDRLICLDGEILELLNDAAGVSEQGEMLTGDAVLDGLTEEEEEGRG